MNLRSTTLLLLVATCLLGTAAVSLGQDDNALKFKLKPGAAGKACLGCHTAFKEKLAKTFIHTPLKNGDCVGCHNPHTSAHGKLLTAETKDICYSCHQQMVPAKAVSVHKVVGDGECLKCHDPHSAGNKYNLVRGGNELCFGCHKEMGDEVAKVRFKHAPVGKCLACHEAHASGKAEHLLKDSVPALCLGCHKPDRPSFVAKHQNYPVASARCTDCHDPHGSNTLGILYNNVHRPVASKMCGQCHEDPKSPNPLKVKRNGYELCRGCHVAAVNDMMGKNRMHWPVLSKEGCLTCHNPHAAKEKALLKGNMLNVCGRCHQDTITRQEKSLSKHQPIKDGQCTACHNAHSGDNLYLTRQSSVIDVCATCHDWQKHSSHPIGDKVRDPRNKNLSVQCLSCHRAHGTEYKNFIPYPTTTDLCTQCHQEYKR